MMASAANPPFSLAGRVALVTGASRGLGLATARVLAAAGATTFLVARDAKRLATAAETMGAAAASSAAASGSSGAGNAVTTQTLAGDLGDPAFAASCVAACVERCGGLDILVNNAGIGFSGPVDQVTDEVWDNVLDVDLKAPFVLSRAAAPIMTQRGWGRIINIASISGQTGGLRASVAYSSAKAGLIGMTKTLARDLARYGVTVNAVAPGQIETEMGSLQGAARSDLEARIPCGRLGSPDDIAYAVLFLASNEAAYITGHTLDVNGGILFR